MINRYLICSVFLLTTLNLYPQENKTLILTMEEAIDMARKQSPTVIAARHSFNAAYWNYRSFKANYLPSVHFGSSPNFNHQINVIPIQDGSSQFVQQNQLMVDGNISVSQNIALTGGNISLHTGISRLDLFGVENSHSYRTSPVSISYQQSLNGYNDLKWDRKITPLYFELAKKQYITELENISTSAVLMFFSLAMAQENLDITRVNYRNADTLYSFAKGRYEIGSIKESEMLQWEVKLMNEESNLTNAQTSLEDNIQDFRIFLGIKDTVTIKVLPSDKIPNLNIDSRKVLNLALENNPAILSMELQDLASKRDVASTRAGTGFQANLYVQVGLSKADAELNSAYKDLLSQQSAQIGLSVPILDWGRGKGRRKMAESSRHLMEIQLEQQRTNFEQSVVKFVRQFNLLAKQISIAEKINYTANKRSDVAQRLYILGRMNILDLNAAISEKDAAKRNCISLLQSFWLQYYELRRKTLYDFEKDMPLTEDYESLLK
jgi:outer membrane protein TolC